MSACQWQDSRTATASKSVIATNDDAPDKLVECVAQVLANHPFSMTLPMGLLYLGKPGDDAPLR